LTATNHGLDTQWNAPTAMPISPNRISAVSQGLECSPVTFTISSLGERGESATEARKLLHFPHIWHCPEPRMVLIGTSGAQLILGAEGPGFSDARQAL
jgi:hypothetical protein